MIKQKTSEIIDIEFIDNIIDKYDRPNESIIMILQDIQRKYRYLPKDALKYVSKKTEIPISQIYSVATFFKSFSLKPKGKHILKVCLGTACHVRGGQILAEQLAKKLGIGIGQTTPDGLFTLEVVSCLGVCAMGPIITIDDKDFYGKMNITKIDKILKKYKDSSNEPKD